MSTPMTCKVILAYRSGGCHEFVKEIEIGPNDGIFRETFLRMKASRLGMGIDLTFSLDEQRLLQSLPEGWLPANPKSILLLVGNPTGATAISSPKKFSAWGKYFGAYSLTVELSSADYDDMFEKATKPLLRREALMRDRIAKAKTLLQNDEGDQDARDWCRTAEHFDPEIWSDWQWALENNDNVVYLIERIVWKFEKKGYPKTTIATAGLIQAIGKRSAFLLD